MLTRCVSTNFINLTSDVPCAQDLLSAIGHTRRGNLIASQHRKKAQFLGSRVVGYVVSSLGASSSVDFIKSMTHVERHAELVYAESLFEKVWLLRPYSVQCNTECASCCYRRCWGSCIQEIGWPSSRRRMCRNFRVLESVIYVSSYRLNMRTTMTIYRSLGAFIEEADAAYAASLSSSTPPPSVPSNSNSTSKPQAPVEDPSIDPHFRSGVYLGIGMSNIILSLMPGKLATFAELFGYKGNRMFGLKMLTRAGGWGEGERRVEPCGCPRFVLSFCFLECSVSHDRCS